MVRLSLAFVLLLVVVSSASAQADGDRFQLTAQFAAVSSGEFDAGDSGVGARFSWHPAALLGAEAEIDFYPREFAGFSGSRQEGLFGVTIGPRLGRVRPFGRVRPGFVAFRDAPRSFGCIEIFPPPLSCRLAAGDTVFALDLGGGLELFPRARALLRLDIGDRLMKYPGPVFDLDFVARQNGFFSHDFRFAVGGGLRF